jgi:hypothetical protein
VRDAFAEAVAQAPISPARAAERLRKLLKFLESDDSLSESRKKALTEATKTRIKQYEAEADKKTTTAADSAAGANRTTQRKADEDRKALEDDRQRRALLDAAALRAAGKSDEAKRREAEIARDYPNSTAAKAAQARGGRADAVAENKRMRDDKSTRLTAVDRDIARSSAPAIGDYELPPDWATRIAKRSSAPKMTAEEKALIKALNGVIEVDLTNRPFKEVLEYLQDKTGQTIFIDKQTMDAAHVTYDSPVSLLIKRGTFRTVLKKMLMDYNLAYIIKDGAIQVVTPEVARSTMTTRSYYVGDLAGIADVRLGPLARELMVREAIGNIIDNIKGSIEPKTWQPGPGQEGGTIVYDPITMTLIIKQTAEVHYMLGGQLR